MGKYRALIVACDFYQNDFAPLPNTVAEARELGTALVTRGFEQFEVQYSQDDFASSVAEAAGRFFTSAEPDDFVLFYFGGHGRKDDDGELYLILRDTRVKELITSGFPAATLNKLIAKCAAQRKVIVLDACYSAAIEHGSRADHQQIEIERHIQQGKGTAILTSSGAVQQAFSRSDRPSFTYFLTDGLRYGKADADQDGLVSVDEWFEYARKGVLNWQTEPYVQTPRIFHLPKEDPIYIGRVPVEEPDDQPASLHLPHSVIPPLNCRLELRAKGDAPHLFLILVNPNLYEMTSIEITGVTAMSSRILHSIKNLAPGQRVEFSTPFFTDTGPLVQLIFRASDAHGRPFQPAMASIDPRNTGAPPPPGYRDRGVERGDLPGGPDAQMSGKNPSSDIVGEGEDESLLKKKSKKTFR